MTSNDAKYRREMGMGMPTPARNLADEVYTVTRKSFEEPKPKELVFQLVMGIWMVDDGDGWRVPTEEEIRELTGEASCFSADLELYDYVSILSTLSKS